MVVCESCAKKWYVCTFCKAASAGFSTLPCGADEECCRDIFYCPLCRSWLETWWQIYPDQKRDAGAAEEE